MIPTYTKHKDPVISDLLRKFHEGILTVEDFKGGVIKRLSDLIRDAEKLHKNYDRAMQGI